MFNKIRTILLVLLLVLSTPAYATISTTQSTVTLQGNGVTNVFQFPFVADSTQDLVVGYTDLSGVLTTLAPSTYTVTINPPSPDSLWGIGGSITYPLSGPPIAVGTSLTIQRVLPLLQTTDISNQGNFYPEVVESTFDTLLMQIQQVAARSGQFRGVWATSTVYNLGDIVQDGPAGDGSGNYYLCINGNISGVWNTDLANGDWQLIITSAFPTTSLPLSITNGGTGATTAPAALSALGGVSLSANNIFTGANSFTSGAVTVPTRSPGDNTTNAASTAFVTSTLATKAPLANPSFTGVVTSPLFSGPTQGVTNGSNAAAGNVGEFVNSSVLFGSAINLSSNTPLNVTSINLTAGDWNVYGEIAFTGNASTTIAALVGNITTTSLGADDTLTAGVAAQSFPNSTLFSFNHAAAFSLSPVRINVTTPTTVYLVAIAGFGTSTCSTYGSISARRVR